MWIIRKVVHDMDELAAMEFLSDKMRASKTNNEFFDSMKR
jgi:transcription termination factor Rho